MEPQCAVQHYFNKNPIDFCSNNRYMSPRTKYKKGTRRTFALIKVKKTMELKDKMIEKCEKKRLMGRFIFLIAMGALFFCLPAGCADKHAAMKGLDCSGYPDWNNSPYILPYRSGESYPVIQGNCADKERPPIFISR
nr:hypothetical protein [Desulfobacula sp.]